MINLPVKANRRFYQSATRIVVAVLCCMLVPVIAHAWQQPDNLREDDDRLHWDSDAPSYNIYEDGVYIATIHGEQRFEPIFENSTYQVVAHDHGVGFTPISQPYLHIDMDDDDESSDDHELSFNEFELYYEVNNTDGDIGIHSFLDGEVWKQLQYLDVNDRTVLNITLSDGLAEQGITELFFESAEPTFDELSPTVFFERFPAGTYEAEGISLNNELIDAETELSSVIPAAPVLYVGDNPAGSVEGCEDEESSDILASLDANGDLPVAWDPVTSSHPILGVPGEITVDGYQFVFETSENALTIELEAGQTEFLVPGQLVNAGDVVKAGVLVRDDTHNQVGSEVCVLVL